MKTDLEISKELFKKDDYTCVLCKGDKIYVTKERGVKPLIEFYDSGKDFSGFSASDKIVGKAAAMIYSVLKVKEVYSPVMSETGAEMLIQNGITPYYDTLVKEIRNRADTGICPMEESVKDLENPLDGLNAIKEKIKQMMKK